LAIWQSGILAISSNRRLLNEGISLVAVFACTVFALTFLDQFSDSRKIGVDCFSIGRFCPMAGGPPNGMTFAWSAASNQIPDAGDLLPCRSRANGAVMWRRANQSWNSGIPENRNSNWSMTCPSSLGFLFLIG